MGNGLDCSCKLATILTSINLNWISADCFTRVEQQLEQYWLPPESMNKTHSEEKELPLPSIAALDATLDQALNSLNMCSMNRSTLLTTHPCTDCALSPPGTLCSKMPEEMSLCFMLYIEKRKYKGSKEEMSTESKPTRDVVIQWILLIIGTIVIIGICVFLVVLSACYVVVKLYFQFLTVR